MFRSLMQYGMGRLADNARTQSCVYSSWMSHGLPREDFFTCDVSMMKVSNLLKKEGIQLIVTGHQPVGDAPWPIQLSPKNGDETATWILPCDTSYSGDTRWTTIEGIKSIDTTNLG